MDIRILTDSTCDLGDDLIKKYGIEIIPLHVTIGGQSYIDGVEIQQKDLFEVAGRVNELPKTAAPSIGEFLECFRIEGEGVFIGISSQLSATIANASLAVKDNHLNHMRVIDSKNLSAGIGLLALRASELRDAGGTAPEIEGAIQTMIPRVRTSFIIDTMDYLYKGGRCSGLQAFAGSVLKIHPVIEVDPAGRLGVKAKFRGGRQKSLRYLLDDFKLNIEAIDSERIFITHVMCGKDAEFIRDEIRTLISSDEIHITEAGSVIASHCGPGTIGILYCIKS